MDGRDTLQDSTTTDEQKERQSGHHGNGQDDREDLKQDGETTYPPPGSCVARNSQRPASVETVQGGVPPDGVKETLVVNGKS